MTVTVAGDQHRHGPRARDRAPLRLVPRARPCDPRRRNYKELKGYRRTGPIPPGMTARSRSTSGQGPQVLGHRLIELEGRVRDGEGIVAPNARRRHLCKADPASVAPCPIRSWSTEERRSPTMRAPDCKALLPPSFVPSPSRSPCFRRARPARRRVGAAPGAATPHPLAPMPRRHRPAPAVPNVAAAERSRRPRPRPPARRRTSRPGSSSGCRRRPTPSRYIRGLYGSSLWLDMQGFQWPYYPRIGVGISGYGWIDTDYKRTRIGDPGQSDHTTKLFEQGRFALRVTPTYSNGTWFVQAQARAHRATWTSSIRAAAGRRHRRRLGPDRRLGEAGTSRSAGSKPSPSITSGMGLDLNTDERIGAYDPATAGRSRSPTSRATSTTGRRGPGTSRSTSIRCRTCAWSCSASGATTTPLNDAGRSPGAHLRPRLAQVPLCRRVPVALRPGSRAHAHNEYRNRGVAGSMQFVLRALGRVRPQHRPRRHRRLHERAPAGRQIARTRSKSGDI